MGRYTYDAEKVSLAIDELTAACETLKYTAGEIQKGISTIQDARGAGYIQIDASAIIDYPNSAVTYIEEMMTQIRAKTQEIEEYNNASCWEKGLSTVGMFITKLGEGVATAGEQITDGFASVLGMVVRSEKIEDFIKTDYVGDFFSEQYENGVLKDINKYSRWSHESTKANIFKGVGVATGYIGVAAVTGGAFTAVKGGSAAAGAAAATSNITLNAGLAGVGGLGSGTQSGLQSGLSYNQAFGRGLLRGGVQASTVFVAGKAADKLSKNGTLDKAMNKAKETGKNIENKIGNKMLGQDVMDDLATVGATPSKYAKDVLKTKISNVTNNVTKPLSKIETSLGNKILGSNVVDDLASAGSTPLGYAKDVLGKKLSNVANKIPNPIASAGSTVVNGIQKAGSTVGTVIHTATTNPVSISIGVTNTVNETIAQNAKSKFKTKTNPSIVTTANTYEEPTSPTKTTDATTVFKETVSEEKDTNNNNSKNNYSDNSNGNNYNPGNGDGNNNSNQLPSNHKPSADNKPSNDNNSSTDNKPTKPNESNNSTTPTEPNKPTTPTEPNKPTTPTEPNKPTIPTEPSKPTTPTEPNKPTIPTEPNKPTIPTEPNKPITPTNPNPPKPGAIIGGGNSNNGNYNGGYTGGTNSNNNPLIDNSLTDSLENSTGSITDTIDNIINKGNKVTKIPTSSDPITSTSRSSGSAVIPIAAGLSAAAAAGIGAKAYIDRKNNTDNGEDEEGITDGISTEEWSGEDNLSLDYNEVLEEENYLDSTDDYSYQAEEPMKYDAKTIDELANQQ